MQHAADLSGDPHPPTAAGTTGKQKVAPPVDFKEVFKAECDAIAERRTLRLNPSAEENAEKVNPEKDLFGISFSGGGIRSATLNLGVLQGLAARKLLRHADYLSTVSGGGYIGSWFQSLCYRKGKREDVEHYLDTETEAPKPPTEDPITFLRKYSNYLSPQLGLLSADTWSIFTIWLRNMALNQLVFYLTLAGFLLLPLILGNLVCSISRQAWLSPYVIGGLNLLALLWAVHRMSANLRPIVRREFSKLKSGESPDNDASAWLTLVLPIFTGAFLLAWLMSEAHFDPLHDTWTLFFSAFGLLALFAMSLWFGGFPDCSAARWGDGAGQNKPVQRFFLGLVIVVSCTAVTEGLLILLQQILPFPNGVATVWVYMTWGPPLVVLALACGVGLQIGLMGVDFPDSAREWYSRLAAKLLIGSVGWTLLYLLVAYVPVYVLWLLEHHSSIGASGTIAWLLTTFVGVRAGTSPASSGTPPVNGSTPPGQNKIVELLAKIAPPIAVAGIFIVIATASFWAIETPWSLEKPGTGGWKKHEFRASANSSPRSLNLSTEGQGDLQVKWSQPPNNGFWQELIDAPRDYRALDLDFERIPWIMLACGLLLGTGFLISARLNINEFSMNHFYKNRLVRCYLGATHSEERDENAFTGFDPKDDILLTDLTPCKTHDAPYPIVNCALNLNHGSELAWQERKASSFIFTPKYCGYEPAREESNHLGYIPTGEFMGKGGPHIGLATAISGAAANPNWGYHTSPVTAFLMTMFNVRLGWWIGNTSNPTSARTAGPRFALRYLFDELFGLTDENSNYLNLSDGGHFENLGLYELIKRKCKYIIASDGEQDENYVFESLGGAIRKARIDFGFSVELSPKRIIAQNGASAVHCALGIIDYGDGNTGHLLYIKSSLTGDEPYDITQYKSANATFPQESTLDQFFSESQFESYRALGRHIVESIFKEAKYTFDPVDRGLGNLFQDLEELWLPASTAQPGAFTKHTEAYSALVKRLSEDDDLRFLDSQLLPGMSEAPGPADPAVMRKAKLLVMDCLQLMEDVYVDLNLEDESQLRHIQNEGWIELFKRWATRHSVLDDVWRETSSIYGTGFQRFYEKLPSIQLRKRSHRKHTISSSGD